MGSSFVLVLQVYIWLSHTPAESSFVNPVTTMQEVRGRDAAFLWRFRLNEGQQFSRLEFGMFPSSTTRTLSPLFAVRDAGKSLVFNPDLPRDFGDGRVVIDADEISKAYMTIQNVTVEKDDGRFFGCRLVTKDGSFIAMTRLEVIYAPAFATKPVTPQTAKEGDSLALACSASAKPVAKIRWYKEGSSVLAAEGDGARSLELRQIKREVAGNYRCEASNDAGSVNTTVQVIVYYKPEIITSLSSRALGSFLGNPTSITLRCAAVGNPEPTFIWNGPQGQEIARTDSFVLTKPSLSDFGTYICEAGNAVGFARHSIVVYQIKKPGTVVVSIPASKIAERSLQLDIAVPADTGNSTLRDMKLTYRGPKGATTVSLALNTSTYNLTGLVPYTLYEIRVTVANEFFVSDESVNKVTTKEDKPGAPVNVSVSLLGPHAMLVSWRPPEEPNGVITGYSVAYFRSDDILLNAVVIPVANVSMLRAELTTLESNTNYSIQVSAGNRMGVGPYSSSVFQRTDPLAPGTPSNLTVSVLGPTKITLSWIPPLFGAADVTMFEVQVSCTGKLSGLMVVEQQRFSSSNNQRLVEVDKLKSYSTCVLKLREGSGSMPSWGNYTAEEIFDMPEDVPSKPTNFTLVRAESTYLFVKWDRPLETNGVLTHFGIRYENSSGKVYEERQSQHILTNTTFYYIIGDLRPSTTYLVHVIAYNRIGESEGSNQLSVKTGILPGVLGKKSNQDGGSGPGTGAIVGGIFSALVIVVLIIGLLVYLLRRKRAKLKEDADVKGKRNFVKLPTDCDSPMHAVEPKIKSTPVLDESFDRNGPGSGGRTFQLLRPIAVADLKDFVAKCHENKDHGFMLEFKSIKPEGDFTWEVSMRPENKSKNRYANIVAYDHTRVILNTVENTSGSDYVNANYIDGFKKKAKFIATQGPVLATFSDFWRMVWEQNTHIIVMVANLVERSRMKCQKYWPVKEAQVYGKISVVPEEEIELADYVIRKFSLISTQGGPSRRVTQFQFTSWPDHGVPQLPAAILQFVRRVRASSTEQAGPVVVHCSAGVGRSGTYIALDAMLDQLEDEKVIDVCGFVTHARSQRNLIVQTEAQYVFVYSALLEAVLFGNTEVSTADLPARMKHLNQINPSTAVTYMQEEFDRLGQNTDDTDQYESALLACNIGKNRFPSILPYESTRVKLWPFPGQEGSDYMNGSFIDGYLQREAYIATQAPMENTIQDFWRMIWEYEVFSIVMISSVMERDMHHCYPYWPISTEPAAFGLLIVQIAAEEEKTGYAKREFRVTNSKTNETRVVSHFMLFDWPLASAPSDPTTIIDMISHVQRTQQMTGNGSIVIHCSDGSGRTGTLCALMSCLERLKLEGVVDVFQTVRCMRMQRKLLVQSAKEYNFIYHAVGKFLESFSNYANFQ